MQDEEDDIDLRLLRPGSESVRPGATLIGQANSTTHRDGRSSQKRPSFDDGNLDNIADILNSGIPGHSKALAGNKQSLLERDLRADFLLENVVLLEYSFYEWCWNSLYSLQMKRQHTNPALGLPAVCLFLVWCHAAALSYSAASTHLQLHGQMPGRSAVTSRPLLLDQVDMSRCRQLQPTTNRPGGLNCN